MHLYAFIAIFVPKIGCHGNAPLSLVYGSVVDEFLPRWHKSYLKTKLCMDMLHTTEVMAIFVIFWPILAKIWLPWQRPLDPCNQKCLLWLGLSPLQQFSTTVLTVTGGFRGRPTQRIHFWLQGSKGRCHGNQILAKIGKKITKMAITSVVCNISMQSLVLR